MRISAFREPDWTLSKINLYCSLNTRRHSSARSSVPQRAIGHSARSKFSSHTDKFDRTEVTNHRKPSGNLMDRVKIIWLLASQVAPGGVNDPRRKVIRAGEVIYCHRIEKLLGFCQKFFFIEEVIVPSYRDFRNPNGFA